jgi:hypothetical protein
MKHRRKAMSVLDVERLTGELLLGSKTLATAGQWSQALMLAFCAVDACSSLARDPKRRWVEREDFLSWVATYLLPVSPELPCTPIDLYAARCGLVHAYSSESSKRVTGDARELVYALPEGSAWRLLARPGTVSAVYVDVRALLEAIAGGIGAFLRALQTDATLEARVKERSDELLRFCNDV